MVEPLRERALGRGKLGQNSPAFVDVGNHQAAVQFSSSRIVERELFQRAIQPLPPE